MIEKTIHGFKIFSFEKLKEEKNLFCCVFSKFFKNEPTADFSSRLLSKNKPFQSFLRNIGVTSLFFPLQRHTANVYAIDEKSPAYAENFDASCSNLPGQGLMGFSADCSLSLFYDKRNKAIGICHAGWRGALLDIYSSLFRTMSLKYSTKPKDLFVGIGPFIAQEDYPVNRDLIEKFRAIYGKKTKDFYYEKKGTIYFSIEKVLRFQLDLLGIKNFEFSGFSTYKDNELFHSYRRKDRGHLAMLAFLKR